MMTAMEFAVMASAGTSRSSLITPVHHLPMHRDQLLEELRRLHCQQENVLLIGPTGIGKTTLLRTLSETLPLTICDETFDLGRLCDCLESRMRWSHEKFSIIVRKNRLLRHLRTHPDPVAFDHVAGTPPRVARFIGHLLDDMPVSIRAVPIAVETSVMCGKISPGSFELKYRPSQRVRQHT